MLLWSHALHHVHQRLRAQLVLAAHGQPVLLAGSAAAVVVLVEIAVLAWAASIGYGLAVAMPHNLGFPYLRPRLFAPIGFAAWNSSCWGICANPGCKGVAEARGTSATGAIEEPCWVSVHGVGARSQRSKRRHATIHLESVRLNQPIEITLKSQQVVDEDKTRAT